jgi:hypothetical protein
MDKTAKLKLLIPMAGLKKSPSAKNSHSKDKLKHLELCDSAKKILATKSKLFGLKDDKALIYSKDLNKLKVKKDIYGHIKSKIGSLKSSDNNAVNTHKHFISKPPRRSVENLHISEKETKTETVSLDKKDSKSCII